MPTITAQVRCPIHDSFRVRQVAGMFDLPMRGETAERFEVEVPGLDEDWSIGLIVGPSGSGKTTVARQVFGDCLYQPTEWPTDRAIVDCFGDRSVKEITQVLSSVGFSSPPAWLRPYGVLSNGEKFRCDLASALMGRRQNAECRRQNGGEERNAGTASSFCILPSEFCIVFDEFTSVVDRTVARIGSAAVSKAIRSGRIDRRFVAVSCHYDIAQWLEPDWVLDMATGKLARGRLRRPGIDMVVQRVHRSAWQLFKRHHYLSGDLNPAAACFVGTIDGSPAAFCAVLPFPHPVRPGWREHRTVCLPDFQGLGMGHALAEFVASLFAATGRPYTSVTSHPAMIRHRARSTLWRMMRAPSRAGRGASGSMAGMARTSSSSRLTAGFMYVGPKRPGEAKNFGIRQVRAHCGASRARAANGSEAAAELRTAGGA